MIRDPSQIKNSNIWQKAGKNNQGPSSLDKRTIIVLGDQKVGKTSFIKIIKSDFDLQTKPSRLIDYYAMKKQGVQIEFYEVSSPKFQSMLEFYIKSQSCAHTTILLCIDLTNNLDLVSRINKKIQNLRSLLKQIVNKKNLSEIKSYNEQRSKYYHFIEKNQDSDIIKRMPFHFVIVGCKYDLFQKMPIQERKWVSRCLRYLAHVNQADIFCSSTKNMQICAEIRNVFIQEILGNRNSGFSNQKDHNKPLFILTGEDKISEMNLPAFNNSGAFNELKVLQQQLQSIFPSRKHIEIKDQKIKPQFNPIGLDSLISKNKKQILSMLNQKRKKKGGNLVDGQKTLQNGLNSMNNFGSSSNNINSNINIATNLNKNKNTKQMNNSNKTNHQQENILENNDDLEQSHQIQQTQIRGNKNLQKNQITKKDKEKEKQQEQEQEVYMDQNEGEENYQDD